MSLVGWQEVHLAWKAATAVPVPLGFSLTFVKSGKVGRLNKMNVVALGVVQ